MEHYYRITPPPQSSFSYVLSTENVRGYFFLGNINI